MPEKLDSTIKKEIDVLYPSRELILNHKINTRFKRMLGPVYHSDLPSMTQQQFADECDLNNLVDKNMRFKDPAFLTKLQMFGSGNKQEPIYGDFASVPEFQHALNVINNASEQFMSLPSNVRARFDNDPVKLLDFVNDPNNYEEGLSLGIYKPLETHSQANAVESGTVAGVSSTPQPDKAAPVGVSE